MVDFVSGSTMDGVIDIEGNACVNLSLSTSVAQTAALPLGIYDVCSTVDAYLKVAFDASSVTTTNGYQLLAGNTVTLLIRAGRKLGAIAATSGSLKLHQVDVLR